MSKDAVQEVSAVWGSFDVLSIGRKLKKVERFAQDSEEISVLFQTMLKFDQDIFAVKCRYVYIGISKIFFYVFWSDLLIKAACIWSKMQ